MDVAERIKGVQKAAPIPRRNANADQTIATASAGQLQKLVRNTSDRLERSKAARFHVKLERRQSAKLGLLQDIIARFREASKRRRTQLNRKLLQHDAHVEQVVKAQKAELAAYEQKIESLEFSHKRLKRRIQAEGEDVIVAEDFAAHALLVEEDQRTANLEDAATRQQKAHEEEISTLETSFEQRYHVLRVSEMSLSYVVQHLIKLRERFVKNLGEMGQKYEEQYKRARELLQLREKVEIHEVEERKNLHINELMASHRSAFEQIKAYYNDITHDNLHLIKELRTEIADSKARAKIRHKQMQGTQQENQQLIEPLRQQENLRCKLEQQLRFYNKDKLALQNIRARDVQLEERIKAAKQCNHQMEQRKHKLERDIEETTRRLESWHSDTNLRMQAKIIVYEQKVAMLFSVLEEMYNRLNALLAKLNANNFTPPLLPDHPRQDLYAKNDAIETLRFELRKTVKSYHDTVLAVRSRAEELGINLFSVESPAVTNQDFVSQVAAPYTTTVAPLAEGNA